MEQRTLIHADGFVYSGFWKSNLFHGKGEFKHSNGAKYVGDWINDKENGSTLVQNPYWN